MTTRSSMQEMALAVHLASSTDKFHADSSTKTALRHWFHTLLSNVTCFENSIAASFCRQLLDTTSSSIQGQECSRDLPFPGILSTSGKPHNRSFTLSNLYSHFRPIVTTPVTLANGEKAANLSFPLCSECLLARALPDIWDQAVADPFSIFDIAIQLFAQRPIFEWCAYDESSDWDYRWNECPPWAK